MLERGLTWLETAFVVNDWYVSAYEPVHDSRGERVGMLYVGFLEAPFRAAKQMALLIVLAISLGVSVAGALLTLRWARSIFRPIERMHTTIGRIDAGEDAARVGASPAATSSAGWPRPSTGCSTIRRRAVPSCRRSTPRSTARWPSARRPSPPPTTRSSPRSIAW